LTTVTGRDTKKHTTGCGGRATHMNVNMFSAAGLAVILQGGRHTMHRTPFSAFGPIILLLFQPGGCAEKCAQTELVVFLNAEIDQRIADRQWRQFTRQGRRTVVRLHHQRHSVKALRRQNIEKVA